MHSRATVVAAAMTGADTATSAAVTGGVARESELRNSAMGARCDDVSLCERALQVNRCSSKTVLATCAVRSIQRSQSQSMQSGCARSLSTDSLLAILSQVLCCQACTTSGPYASDSLNADHARPPSFDGLRAPHSDISLEEVSFVFITIAHELVM